MRIFQYNGGHSREIYHTKRMQRFIVMTKISLPKSLNICQCPLLSFVISTTLVAEANLLAIVLSFIKILFMSYLLYDLSCFKPDLDWLLFIYDLGFSVSNLVAMQVILSQEVMTPTFACGKPKPLSNWEWYVSHFFNCQYYII